MRSVDERGKDKGFLKNQSGGFMVFDYYYFPSATRTLASLFFTPLSYSAARRN